MKRFLPRPSTLLVFLAILTFSIVSLASPDPKTAAHKAGFYRWWIFPLVIANWIIVDARERRRSLCYDYEGFLFWIWPFLGPVYLVQTRRWRAAYPIMCFALLWIIVGIVTTVLQSFLHR